MTSIIYKNLIRNPGQQGSKRNPSPHLKEQAEQGQHELQLSKDSDQQLKRVCSILCTKSQNLSRRFGIFPKTNG
jgi:hypothetical protein